MHFEILVEDQSGKKALRILVPKIIGQGHILKFRSYKGIGHIPKEMKTVEEANQRTLLGNLPEQLKAYGKTFAGDGSNYSAAVIVVCDLDRKDKATFLNKLSSILSQCQPQPDTYFCLAIEEGEAWFLGDLDAIKAAYPQAKETVLAGYVNDSICGTWELLADAIYKGGSRALSAKGWQAIGREKSRWAENIAPHMDVNNNQSPSFVFFRTTLETLSTRQ